jgi:hypothetical protein
MTNITRHVLIGALISGIVLGAHALYFNSAGVYIADTMVFLAIVLSWSFLLNGLHALNKPVENSVRASSGDPSFIQQSSAFHVQLGNEISEQLNSAHTELGNTQAILNDAITKLVSNFIAISDGVRILSEHTNNFSKQIHGLVTIIGDSLSASEKTLAERSISKLSASELEAAMESNQRVQSMMTNLNTFNDVVEKNAVELNLINSNVEQNVLVVISTLQFQDMSSQLIEHARLRMSALQEVANEMGKGAGSPNYQQYLDQIAAYNRLLDKHVVSLDKQKANPVAQKDFGTGDIELF